MKTLEEALLAKYSYNPDSGKIFNKSNGKEVGHFNSRNYLSISVTFDEKDHEVIFHRAAWFLHFHYWPVEIDHKNRNRTDNRLCNLRAGTRGEFAGNKGMMKNNSSGVPGVHFSKGKWMARLQRGKDRKYLGIFSTKEEAAFAVEQAEAQNGPSA